MQDNKSALEAHAAILARCLALTLNAAKHFAREGQAASGA